MVRSFWKAVWQFLKKLNRHWVYNTAIPFLDIYPIKIKNICLQKDWYRNVHWRIVHNSYLLETTQMPRDRRMTEWTAVVTLAVLVTNRQDRATHSHSPARSQAREVEWTKRDTESTYLMIRFHKTLEQARLTRGDRNQSSDCLWRADRMKAGWAGTQGNFRG